MGICILFPFSPCVGDGGSSCLLLPGAAFQQIHAVPVRGDVRVCARWLQSSGRARPRLEGTTREREAAAGIFRESDRTPTEQGRRVFTKAPTYSLCLFVCPYTKTYIREVGENHAVFWLCYKSPRWFISHHQI